MDVPVIGLEQLCRRARSDSRAPRMSLRESGQSSKAPQAPSCTFLLVCVSREFVCLMWETMKQQSEITD